MGIRRGNFESASLGQVATSAKVASDVKLDSVARGMRAFGAGLGAVSDFCGKMASMANKAYAAKNMNAASFQQSLGKQTEALTNLENVKAQYEGNDSPEAKEAISIAQKNYDSAVNDSNLKYDRLARTGLFYSTLGQASAESGAERLKAVKDGDTGAANQSFFGVMLTSGKTHLKRDKDGTVDENDSFIW